MTRERLARIGVARALAAFTIEPTRVVASVTGALGGVRSARVARPAPQVPRLVVSLSRDRGRPAPLVVPLVVAIGAPSPATAARRNTVFVA
jgi:hypothetical protein